MTDTDQPTPRRRGRPSGARNSSETYRAALLAQYLAVGKSIHEAATLLGVSEQVVRKLLTKPDVRAMAEKALDELRAAIHARAVDLGTRFDAESEAAFNTLASLHRGTGDDPERPVPYIVRRAAACDILDRAPSAPKAKQSDAESRHLHIHIPPKALGSLTSALREAGQEDVARLVEADTPGGKEDAT